MARRENVKNSPMIKFNFKGTLYRSPYLDPYEVLVVLF